MSANTASIIAIMGASGMGKGQNVKALLLEPWPGITLIWSPLEWSDKYAAWIGARAVSSIPGLVAAIKRGARSVVYVPSARADLAKQFDLFCRTAWACGARVVVEELSDVTKPSHAPASWAMLTKQGRHMGMRVMGVAQRPAQVDKTFFGNCTVIRCYRLVYPEDAQAVAPVLRVPWAELLELPKLHFLERHMDEMRTVRGVQDVVSRKKAGSVARIAR